MLLHLRLTVPSALTAEVVDLLLHDDRSANLTLSRGASLSPRATSSSATSRASWRAR